jgi:hypothetical protein
MKQTADEWRASNYTVFLSTNVLFDGPLLDREEGVAAPQKQICKLFYKLIWYMSRIIVVSH